MLLAGSLSGLLASPRLAAGASDNPPVTFTEILISSDYSYAYGLAAADIDGDGDVDLTSSDATGNDALYWYENDGSGGFTRHSIRQGEPGLFERHTIADLNGDGFPDVVVVKNLDGQIVWFENDGTPKDDLPWARHVITSALPFAYDVVVGDLDHDGDLDVAASSYKNNQFVWFENPGNPTEENWPSHLIGTAAQTRTIRIADFNGDGWPDLLGSAAEEGLYWFENSGTPAAGPWTAHLIKRGTPVHGEPLDMNGDGRPDIVMSGFDFSPLGGGAVDWYENRRGGRFKRHPIDHHYPFAFEAAGGDLDGDGDLDVVSSAWNSGGLAWFENLGGGRRWRKHVLRDSWFNGNSVLVLDLNGDGRPDIVSTAENGTNELRWWRNDGPPSP